MVKNGYVVEGMSILRSGSTALRATGAEAGTPNNIALLAEAYEISGQMKRHGPCWTKPCRPQNERGSAFTRQSSIDTRAGYY
jgi:hypothetical protein